MIAGPILGTILVSVVVKLGVRLAATVVKGVMEAMPSSGGATREARESFPALLKGRAILQAALSGNTPDKPSVVEAPPRASLALSDLIGRLASEEQARSLALGMETRKNLPAPAPGRQAKQIIAAYHRLDSVLG